MASSDRPVGIRPVGATGGVRLLVFGVAGSGKTRLIGTGSKTLIIRPPTDSTASIEQPTDAIELVVHDHSELLETFQWLQQGRDADVYDWVWLDGISLFEDYGLDDVFQHVIDIKPSRAEHGPDKGEYGTNRQRIMKWVRDMVGLCETGQFNFGITAVPWNIYDPVREDDIWMPQVGPRDGSLSHKLCGYMNVVSYLRVIERKDKPTRRVLYTDRSGFAGKDQITKGELNELVEPTMPKITAAFKDARKGQSGRRAKRPARKRQRKEVAE